MMRRFERLAQACVLACLVVAVPRLAWGQADLISSIQSITVVGQQTQFTVRVCNNGNQAATSGVALYYNLATGPDCTTVASHLWPGVALAAGACTNLLHTRAATPQGSYTAWARADWNCQVAETDETNNNSSRDYTVLPNLAVNLNVTVVGTTATYSAVVYNTGVAITTPFTVALYYDRATAPTCGTAPDHSWTVNAIGAATSLTLPNHVRTSTPAGAFTAWAFADSACVITESVETNNTAQRAYQVGPNIYVYAPNVTVSGSSVTFSVTVCNYGTAATGAFSVRLWYHLAAAPACGATGADHTWSLTNLPPSGSAGSCTTLIHTRNNAPGGTFTARAFADPTCALNETVETDNIGSRTYTVASPDFQFSAFSVVVSGSTVTYNAILCNQGATTTRQILVGLFFNAATAPTCASTPSFTWPAVNGLASGGCVPLTHTENNVTVPGVFTAWVLADRDCSNPETDETNNARSAPYAIAPTQPDLHITSFTATPSGSNVGYAAVVCNAGVATTTSFLVGLYHHRATAPACNTPPDASHTQVGGLASGACATLNWTQTNAAPGSYIGWLLVDQTCVVSEYGETNNAASANYTIASAQQPDLQVTSLTVTPTGSTVGYSAIVCNNGTGAAAASTVGLYYNRATAPSQTCVDAPDATAAVGPLAASACETKTWSQSNTAPGSYTAWAHADSACAVSESSESNNTTSKAYTVSALQPDLGVPDAVVSSDGAPKLDGPKTDAAPKTDGGKSDGPTVKTDGPVVASDGAVKSDGVPAGDGAVKSDGGQTGDGPAVSGDGKPRADAATTPVADDGCGCELAALPPASGASLLLLGLGLLLVLRRRR